MPRARPARRPERVTAPADRRLRVVGPLLACVSLLVAVALAVPALLAPAPNGRRQPPPARTERPRPPLPRIDGPVPEAYDGLAAEARSLGASIVERYGDRPQAVALEAVILSETGDQSAAAEKWRRHLEDHPGNAEGWYRLGLHAVREGEDADAATMLARARSLDPTLPDVQAHLGRALLKQDRVDEAAAVLEPVGGDDRGAAVRLFHLGHARLRQGRPREALAAFRDAVARAPAYTGAWYGVATAASRLGLDAEADEARERFRTLKVRDADAATGDRARDETLRLRRSLARWYSSAGRIAALAGDVTAAENLWTRGVAVEPALADNRRALEELFRRQGRSAEAERVSGAPAEPAVQGGR